MTSRARTYYGKEKNSADPPASSFLTTIIKTGQSILYKEEASSSTNDKPVFL